MNCSSKEHAGSEPFGDDLTERLKTVEESKKEAQQLTKQKNCKVSLLKGITQFQGEFLFYYRGRCNHKRTQTTATTKRKRETIRLQYGPPSLVINIIIRSRV